MKFLLPENVTVTNPLRSPDGKPVVLTVMVIEPGADPVLGLTVSQGVDVEMVNVSEHCDGHDTSNISVRVDCGGA